MYSTSGRTACLYINTRVAIGKYFRIFENWKSLYENLLKMALKFDSLIQNNTKIGILFTKGQW